MALASRVKAEKAAEKQKILESMTEEELAKLEYDNTRIFCPICQKRKVPASFRRFRIDENKKKRVLLCNSCCNDIYSEAYQATLNSNVAIWTVCMRAGVPCIAKAWTEAQGRMSNQKRNSGNVSRPWMAYMDAMDKFDKPYRGIWQSDIELSDFIKIRKANESKPKEVNSEFFNYDEQVKFWGCFSSEDFIFLNQSLDSYMSNVPNPDINTVNRYKDLAIAELRLRKANERGDISEIAKCQDILNKQLNLLNLNHFENNTKTKEDLLLEKKINMIEFEKPAECEDLKKYLDMVGFEKDNSDNLRVLQNAIAGTKTYPNIPGIEV